MLDYCSSLWEPHQAYLINKLKSVQCFAARVISHRWKDSYSHLPLLGWSSLKTRRAKLKIGLCCRIVGGHSVIPPSFFTPHPSPYLRHVHSEALKVPTCRLTSRLHSFVSSVIPLWNSLPPSIFEAITSFKHRLRHNIILTTA